MADPKQQPQSGVVLLSDIVGVAQAAALTNPSSFAGQMDLPRRPRRPLGQRMAAQLAIETT